MILVTLNKSRQLLCVSYIGHVQLEDFRRTREELIAQMRELSPGFTLLADSTDLEMMDRDCASELGRIMELMGRAGVGLVVRIIPDPTKDIGVNILMAFHYSQLPRTVTCQNMTEAARALEL